MSWELWLDADCGCKVYYDTESVGPGQYDWPTKYRTEGHCPLHPESPCSVEDSTAASGAVVGGSIPPRGTEKGS